ncbi:double-strand break repair protein AddB [Desertibaculum subflavum]|uniref:double-strand break repair protein AddB n=1 Tax=Desertibaculum subflavum TaxID=2268458 RepID=UPI000E66AAAC
MAAARPSVFSIPTGTPFVDALAAGILARHGTDPLELSEILILLPNRRAARALREAFLRVAEGRALLLPRMRALGDVDEDELALTGIDLLAVPKALPELRRLVLLAREVKHRPEVAKLAQALALAGELARLIDEVRIDGVDLRKLAGLVPETYAAHWQATLDFLRLLTDRWPEVLAESAALDASERRNRLLKLQAERWRGSPPVSPVYVAGSTGSIPASAELIGVVARLAQGAVVLPGFDTTMTADDRAAIAVEPTHPQAGMLRLLAAIDVDAREVGIWDSTVVPAANAERLRLVRESLRPADTAHGWAAAATFEAEASNGLRFIEAQSPREEAAAIALLLRETLETPARRAALVTPDRDLARRVAAMLARWGIAIDDSAGIELARTPPGGLLRLLAAAAAQDFAAVPLLAALKHPLAAGGMAPVRFRRAVRRLERRVLRGRRPPPGLDGLRDAVLAADVEPELAAFAERLIERLGPIAAEPTGDSRMLGDHLHRLVTVATALATDERGCRLWHGDAGEALAAFVDEASGALDDSTEVAVGEWPAVLDRLMAGIVVRPGYGRHPRLAIWGPIEARLQQADRLVLGGLNEGTWPAEAAADPWLNRPMREALGLPPPERRIGLAAHDLQQALGAGDVILTRALRVEGAKTVPSRWWLRLSTLLGSARPLDRDVAAWAAALDQPAQAVPEKPPAPRPPVEARPVRLSVTRVEALIRDPYAIYARFVLGLKPLDPLDPAADALERGNFVHAALDRFVRAYPQALPGDAERQLVQIGSAIVAERAIHPATLAFWWPRFRRIAAWFVDWERARRASGILPIATEVGGTLDLGGFTLTGTADRIDRLPDGRLALLDYKTGNPPSDKQVEAGFAPQLPLEAAMAARGAFTGIPAGTAGELTYLRLSGGREAGKVQPVKRDAAVQGEAALEGLKRLVARYGRQATPYLSRPRPQFLDAPGDYDHLARLGEWSPYGDER